MSKSAIEEGLALAMTDAGLEFVRQYRFCERRWKFDFAFPSIKLAVEVEGGTWSGGRHVRGKGFAGDCEKLNAAVLDGWYVLRYTGDWVKSGKALEQIKEAVRLLG